MTKEYFLSKSQSLQGLQCLKAIWLRKHKPELMTLFDDYIMGIIEEGRKVGEFARQLFPQGKLIEFKNRNFEEALRLTHQFLKYQNQTLFEAAFCYKNIFVMIDVLTRGLNDWEMYEVKAASGIREIFLNDIALQYFVVSNSGLPISKVKLINVNTDYVRKKNVNVSKLFNKTDVTEIILERQSKIEKRLNRIYSILLEPEPDISIGPHCNKPYECRFKNYCWKNIPAYSVFNIGGLTEQHKFELYNNGIVEIKDIPEDYELSKNKKIQVDCERYDLEVIDKKAIKAFLDSLTYPLYFLDFESFQKAIPPFKNTYPYQQIPFQYSLHCLTKPKAKLKHYEFLAGAGKDPRKKLIKHLISHIPNHSSVLCYSAFEKQTIKALAYQFPIYASRLLQIANNIVDLMIPFQKRYFYTKEMMGSHSIKNVLPALAPELNYNELEIKNGGIASQTYSKLNNLHDPKQIAKIRKDLVEYCKLDTLAMVKLLGKLQSSVKNKTK